MKPPNKLDITKIDFPDAAGLVEEIENSSTCSPAASGQESNTYAIELQNLSRALVAVANQSWRIAGSIFDQDSKEAKSELTPQEIKKVGKALDSMKETLEALGINIIDRIGQPFNAGLPEQVVTEEPRSGITKEQIERTIRPTIMWNQTMVQRGEIDIAVPTLK